LFGDASQLFQRDEPRAVSGANAGTTVLHRFVGDGELAKVVADHLCADFYLKLLL
jgi:hypothetical protein